MRCAHCDSTSIRTVLRVGSSASYRCLSCGGRFNLPGTDTDGLYDRDYYARNYLSRRDLQRVKSRAFAARVRAAAPDGPALDYGCGSGVFLEALLEAGFSDCVGADVSTHALEFVRDSLGDRVRTVRIGTDALPDGKFAAICLMDSISHIRHLRETMSRLIDDHLDRNGVLVIRTPDIRPGYFRAVCALRPIIGSRRAAKLAFAHVRYVLFSAESLHRYVHSLGLAVVFEERGPDYHVYRGGIARVLANAALRVLHSRARSIFLIAHRPGED